MNRIHPPSPETTGLSVEEGKKIMDGFGGFRQEVFCE